MRCLMPVWSSHRGKAAENMDESAPPFLLLPALQTQLRPCDGWNRLESYLWEQKVLSPSVCTWRSECHYMVGGEGKKDIWHWNEVHACNCCRDGRWLQFTMWPFQRWKLGRPPKRSWASLLFQSCPNHIHQGTLGLDPGNSGRVIDLQCLLQWHWVHIWLIGKVSRIGAEHYTHMWLWNI